MRHRLRRFGPVLMIALLIGATLWINSRLRRVPEEDPGRVSLIVLENISGSSGRIETQRLLRIPILGGRAGTPEPVWEGDASFFGHRGTHRILDGRFVVSASAGVIDLQSGRVLQEPVGELLLIENGLVLFRRKGESVDIHDAFDPRTGEVSHPVPPGRFRLPGLRSPDGTRSVVGGTQLTIHQAGRERVLPGTFLVELHKESLDRGRLPVLWLDDRRILTQSSNGVLVEVNADTGARTPVAAVPCVELITSPTLTRDTAGTIIYDCWSEYRVDPVARKAEPATSIAVGHEFERECVNLALSFSGAKLWHRSELIPNGWAIRWRSPGDTLTADGAIAVLIPTEDPVTHALRDVKHVRFWSEASREWSLIEVNVESLVGWGK